MIPVPGYGVSTPYGRRGPYWSCDKDAAGNGIHTGQDYAAPSGAKCVAARPGTVAHVNHGSAFGYHQLEVRCADGTADFYAHMRSRAPAGTRVDAGDKVGEVGTEGNVTGAHLHFERHAAGHTGWSCSIVRDPAPSVAYQPSSPSSPSSPPEEEPMPTWIRASHDTDTPLQAATWKSVTWDSVPNGADYINEGEAAIRIANKAFTATLVATLDAHTETNGTIRTRFVEKEERGGVWEDVETYPGVEHPVTGGGTVVSDTRVQKVTDGRRLVAQVYAPEGGTLTSASINLLVF
jgi:hypothetical protein